MSLTTHRPKFGQSSITGFRCAAPTFGDLVGTDWLTCVCSSHSRQHLGGRWSIVGLCSEVSGSGFAPSSPGMARDGYAAASLGGRFVDELGQGADEVRAYPKAGELHRGDHMFDRA